MVMGLTVSNGRRLPCSTAPSTCQLPITWWSHPFLPPQLLTKLCPITATEVVTTHPLFLAVVAAEETVEKTRQDVSIADQDTLLRLYQVILERYRPLVPVHHARHVQRTTPP